MNQQELDWFLAQYIGTENYYRHSYKFYFTDGIKGLADKVGAYWLIDMIASYAPRFPNFKQDKFLAKLKCNPNANRAIFTITDLNDRVLIKQMIEYTDFPVESITLIVGKAYLNPSEECWVTCLLSED